MKGLEEIINDFYIWTLNYNKKDKLYNQSVTNVLHEKRVRERRERKGKA